MNKYDKMLDANEERNRKKEAQAKTAIYRLLDENKRVSVNELVRMTGLSRGYFYNNKKVRAEITKAMEQQLGMPDPRRSIFREAEDDTEKIREETLKEMEQEIDRLQKQVKQLQAENTKLRQTLNKKAINLLIDL